MAVEEQLNQLVANAKGILQANDLGGSTKPAPGLYPPGGKRPRLRSGGVVVLAFRSPGRRPLSVSGPPAGPSPRGRG